MTDRTDRDKPAQAAVHAARLAHDLGKYISRTARNLPDGPIPDNLLGLLVKDLYATDGRRRASALFNALVGPIEQIVRDERLDSCRELLGEIDRRETEVRAGNPDTVRRVAALAIKIDETVWIVAREWKEALEDDR